jgi:hypothetical protein
MIPCYYNKENSLFLRQNCYSECIIPCGLISEFLCTGVCIWYVYLLCTGLCIWCVYQTEPNCKSKDTAEATGSGT